MPGVTLDELWEVVSIGERALLAITALVSLVSVAGLVAVILAGLNERRRELAILRAVGAGPRYVWLLLATEGGLVTLLGAALGLVTCLAGVVVLRSWFQRRFGIVLHAGLPSADQWTMLSAVVLFGWLGSLLPGWRAFKLSLVDGLTPRI
jgi:putative ABC transport system permease protein